MSADDFTVVISRVELVRATDAASLLRIDMQAGPPTDGALLVVRGVGLPRRLTPLPTQPASEGLVRLAFAVPVALRDGRFALQLGEREVPLHTPSERTREDAVAAVQLQKLRARVAELESAPAAPAPTAEAEAEAEDAADPHRTRLEQQLTQHRHMRAELNRELDAARELARQMENALEAERDARARLEQELATEQQGRADQEARLGDTIAAARARVAYLENRLVELQARSQQLDE